MSMAMDGDGDGDGDGFRMAARPSSKQLQHLNNLHAKIIADLDEQIDFYHYLMVQNSAPSP